MLAGQVNTGGVLSSINMVCVQLLELPQSSAAVQVRVMVNSCGHAPATVTSLKVGITLASQLSVAVADPVAAGAELVLHSIVIFCGQVITGDVVSSTNMVWVQVLELPQSSIAEKVLVMVNSCGHAPPTVTSENPMVGVPSQLSVAVALPVVAVAVLVLH
jgi:hypothetical protein